MTRKESTWAPLDLVLSGRFSGSAHLSAATAHLSSVADSPLIVATFSAYYLLPSLSRVVGLGDPRASVEAIEQMRAELTVSLRHGAEVAVADACTRVFRERFGTSPEMLTFGGVLNRPGDLRVAVFSLDVLVGSLKRGAVEIAACAMGSRNAAFHRENAIGLWIQRQISDVSKRIDAGRSPATVDDLGAFAFDLNRLQTRQLLALVRDVLAASAIATYETSGEVLRLSHLVGEVAGGLAPQEEPIDRIASIPAIPELGGQDLGTLGTMANACVTGDRRLVGLVGGRWCVGSPFGAEHVGDRPAGAICLMLDSGGEMAFGSYELSLLRLVATHLARAAAEKRWSSAVGFVTDHLSKIAGLSTLQQSVPLTGCAPALLGREDIGLSSGIIAKVLADIASLSGAMSVTCRLVAGGEGSLFSRELYRLHCVGDECAVDSPVAISLDRESESVNAWVAVNGRAAYLRTMEAVDDEGFVRSPDLARYRGLEKVVLFRDSVLSELCVPIFAEGKLVGTINLEARRQCAFDQTAEVIDECAQLVGVALLEARRQISVGTMSEARGFLARRHELENRLVNLGEELARVFKGNQDVTEMVERQIRDLRRFVYMKQTIASGTGGETISVEQIFRDAMSFIEWTYKSVFPAAFAEDKSAFISLSKRVVSRECGDALLFAITQALLNVRKYGSKVYTWADWPHPTKFALEERRLGGRLTLYVAIQSVCLAREIADVEPNRVFREPIHHSESGRTSLGAFLAGEVLRRWGGSAYFRVEAPLEFGGTLRLVTAEFGVPISDL
jgi:hypothetical protein